MAAAGGDRLVHQRQSMRLCAMHTVNNLLQLDGADRLTKTDMDECCYELSPGWWRNPHRSMTGTGNYDANVLFMALERRGVTTRWHDGRKPAAEADLDGAVGLVVNEERTRIAGFWLAHHWLALLQRGGVWYNLDSKLEAPEAFESEAAMREFLQGVLDGGGQVIVAVPVSSSSSSSSGEAGGASGGGEAEVTTTRA